LRASRDQLQRAAGATGFTIDSLEKVCMLVRVLDLMAAHPFLGSRFALKGGTALNLFVLPDRDTMLADRPKVDIALAQVFSRLGLTAKRVPGEHAGGKWRLSYTSSLGRPEPGAPVVAIGRLRVARLTDRGYIPSQSAQSGSIFTHIERTARPPVADSMPAAISSPTYETNSANASFEPSSTAPVGVGCEHITRKCAPGGKPRRSFSARYCVLLIDTFITWLLLSGGSALSSSLGSGGTTSSMRVAPVVA
jgi:hypothetical protein